MRCPPPAPPVNQPLIVSARFGSLSQQRHFSQHGSPENKYGGGVVPEIVWLAHTQTHSHTHTHLKRLGDARPHTHTHKRMKFCEWHESNNVIMSASVSRVHSAHMPCVLSTASHRVHVGYGDPG